MEILMKLKCSPSATPRQPHSHSHSQSNKLKVVDHHHQLQQQHVVGHASHLPQPPSLPLPLPPPLHVAGMSLPPSQSGAHELMLPACLEYATTMDCCGVAAPQDLVDLPWEHGAMAMAGSVSARSRNMQMPSRAHCADYANGMYASTHSSSSSSPLSSSSRSMSVVACCGAYEPACCSGLTCRPSSLLPPPLLQPPPPPQQQPLSLALPQANAQATMDNSDNCSSFGYQEPDENFISIDDAKVKGFLMKIGQKEKMRRDRELAKADEARARAMEPVVYEIIELDDDELEMSEQDNVKSTTLVTTFKSQDNPETARKTKSSEDPASGGPKAKKEKIVARIDLVDSSDSEREEDEEAELPMAAAAAVSCELDCDADDNEEDDDAAVNSAESDAVLLNSDDDDDEENIDFIDEHEEGVEVRWDDLEAQRERAFFECFLCGKKVQSSYNLRRHMMIHTGERPFGCDMCERRFREFSDLKKHRRRHVHDANFVCMICRVNTPTEHDPTRCQACDAKNGAALASLRPQLSPGSPEKSQTPPVALKPVKAATTPKPPSRNLTPAPQSNVSTPTPPAPPAARTTPSRSPPLPPLTPIVNGTSGRTQLLLDNISAKQHRPSSSNQVGATMTRKEFPCPLCQRPFGTRHNLKRHFMIHTGEKPFSCPKCRKPFREYSTLKKHLVTHQRDRWYKCHQCPQKYRDYLKYMEHKNTHPKSEETQSPSKKKSKFKHAPHEDSYEDSNEEDSSTEDWLECCECGQRFTDIEVYTEHLKEHDPTVFLYECYICKRTFAKRDVLMKHMEEQHESTESESNDDGKESCGADEKRLEMEI